ncbi:hypothetical protein [Frankia sp. CcWB2]
MMLSITYLLLHYVPIDGSLNHGLGVERAVQLVGMGRNVAVLTMRWRGLAGPRLVIAKELK